MLLVLYTCMAAVGYFRLGTLVQSNIVLSLCSGIVSNDEQNKTPVYTNSLIGQLTRRPVVRETK